MSLQEAVRFRYLAAQLTKQEKNHFLLQLINNCEDLLISSLFNHFNSTSTDHAVTVQINNKISQILNSRETSKQSSKSKFLIKPKPKLNEMAKPLISKIASFLSQTEYANLSKVNRSIFIASHSPNSLQSIYFEGERNKNYFPFNCDLYGSTKHLHFDLTQYRHRLDEINNKSFLDQLQSITFDGNCNPDRCVVYYLEDDLPICPNIEQLYLSWWTQEMKVKDYEFQRILSKFPNVQYLQLRSVRNVDFSAIKSIFPGLKGLDIDQALDDDGWKYIQIVKDFGDKLEYLSFESNLGKLMNNLFNETQFSKLRELRLNSVATIINIVKTAKNLNKLSLWLLSQSNKMHTKIDDDMAKLMVYCPSLYYIDVYDTKMKYMVSILEGIKNGFMETKDKYRKMFKIRIKIYAENNNVSNLVLPISSLINQMEQSKIDNFVLIWELYDVSKICAEQIKSELCQKCESNVMLTVGMYSWSGHLIVIQNDGCKINGYGENWRMSNII